MTSFGLHSYRHRVVSNESRLFAQPIKGGKYIFACNVRHTLPEELQEYSREVTILFLRASTPDLEHGWDTIITGLVMDSIDKNTKTEKILRKFNVL